MTSSFEFPTAPAPASARLSDTEREAALEVLRDGAATSALIGASKVEQIEQNVSALRNLEFSGEELARIENSLEEAS